MKKINYIIFALCLLLNVIIVPKALVTSLTPSKSNVTKDEKFTISLVVSGLDNYGLVTADYNVTFDTSKVTLDQVTIAQGKPSGDISTVQNNGTLKISYYDNSGGNSPFKNGTIINITFISKASSGTASFTLTGSGFDVCQNENNCKNIEGTTKNTTINFYQPSSEAFLKSLSISGMSLNPTFSSNTKSYTLPDTDLSQISVSATASDGAKISGTGTKKLNYGSNTISLTVTAEDGKTKNTYTIKVNRVDNRSSDSKLKSLTIEGIEIDFNSDNYVYDITLPENLTTLNIKAEANDSKSVVSGTGLVNIGTDITSHVISVTAENGATTDYIIRFINRGEQTDPSTELTKLVINNININLDGSTTYLFGVDSIIDALSIKYETKSKTAVVTIDNASNLKTGINRVVINVIDGDLKAEYVILVNKNSTAVKINSLNELNDKDGDVLVELANNANKIIPKEILSKVATLNGKLYINIVNEYGGLLYGFILEGNIEANKDLDLNILINNSTPITLATSLPAGITVIYYLGDVDTNGLSIYTYSSTDNNQTLLSETIPNNNGYISFTTNGAERYTLTNEAIQNNQVTPTTKKEKSFSFSTFIIGFVAGIAVSVGAYFLIKNKDKFTKSKSKTTSSSVINRKSTDNITSTKPGSLDLNSSQTANNQPNKVGPNVLDLSSTAAKMSEEQKTVTPQPEVTNNISSNVEPVNNIQSNVEPINNIPSNVEPVTGSPTPNPNIVTQPTTEPQPTQPVQNPTSTQETETL